MQTLRELRRARGLDIRGLAAAAGVSPRTVNQAELGRQVPYLRQMWQIARALDTVPLGIAEFAGPITEGRFPEDGPSQVLDTGPVP